MSKIERKTQKIFGGNAPNDEIAVLGSFKTGTPIYTDDITTLQNKAYEDGFGAALVANEAPFLEEQNSIPYVLSKQLAYLFQEGIPEYDADTTYYIGSFVKSIEGNSFILYFSLQDDNIGNALTDLDYWHQVVLDGGANTSLSNLTSEGEKHFLNKTQITNCILEAPNGVATYTGDTITVKQGLKVLIPNGRNVDGILSNIEYTLPNDVTYTLASSDRPSSMLILKNDGTLTHANPYYYQTATPSSNNGIWFNPNDNYIYINDVNKNTIVYGAVIGSFATTTNGISWLSSHFPVELLKRTDVSQMWVKEKATTTSTASVSLPAVVTQNYINGKSWYRIYSDGWIEQGGPLVVDMHAAISITLLRKFSNTNYMILYGRGGWNDSFTRSDEGITEKTTTGFTYGTTSGSNSNGNWYACGY
nr:MAG TPA: hypothetical protein [Caudoviricetes sp.]